MVLSEIFQIQSDSKKRVSSGNQRSELCAAKREGRTIAQALCVRVAGGGLDWREITGSCQASYRLFPQSDHANTIRAMPAFSLLITFCAVCFVGAVNRFAKRNANLLATTYTSTSGMMHLDRYFRHLRARSRITRRSRRFSSTLALLQNLVVPRYNGGFAPRQRRLMLAEITKLFLNGT